MRWLLDLLKGFGLSDWLDGLVLRALLLPLIIRYLICLFGLVYLVYLVV